jgi:flavin-dependent dehydrogenase
VNPARSPPADFEVAIIGGGPAGSATALALAGLGISGVLMVEAGRYDRVRIGESLPPDTRIPLEALGIWSAFLDERHEPSLGSCAAWGADIPGYNASLFSPLGNGWHLDRRRFDAFLARTASERGIEVRMETRLAACDSVDGGRFRLRIVSDGGPATVTAGFVVDATGTRSFVARRLGAKRLLADQLLCVAGFFENPASSSVSKLTMLEAVEYGWWYAANLPDKRLAIVLASDPDILKRDGLLRRDAWLARLAATEHVSKIVADCWFVGARPLVCAAPSYVLDRTAGMGWLAVGDAAAAYDPISSQGIRKALSDGIEAASVIAAYLGGGAEKLGEWQASRARLFDGYLKTRDFFYGMESRWPSSSFWSRRHARPALPHALASGTRIRLGGEAALGHPA